MPKIDGETPEQNRERTFRMSKEIEKEINSNGTFVKPNFLEYEQVSFARNAI